MSTKATIAYGNNFHFYEEVLDTHYVYLELEGVQYEAHYNQVTVPIPIHIWEVIRKRGGPDLSLAGLTDEELQERVACQVDERIDKYQETLAEKPAHVGLLAIAGSLPFGLADTPREEQVMRGLEYYRILRRDQQEIKAAIEELEAKNSRRGVE